MAFRLKCEHFKGVEWMKKRGEKQYDGALWALNPSHVRQMSYEWRNLF